MLERADAAPPITSLPVELVVRESSGAQRSSRRARKQRDREVAGT
jgi:hypothetical protein